MKLMTGSSQLVRDAVKMYANAKNEKKVAAAEQEILQIKSDIAMLEKKVTKPKNAEREYSCKWVERDYIKCEISLIFLEKQEWVMIQNKCVESEEIAFE